jgi:hypothetical protein
MWTSIQIERIHRNEKIGLATWPWHLLLVVKLLEVVRALVHVIRSQGATESTAGCARLQRSGTPSCRRIAHRIVVQTASRIYFQKETNDVI